MTSPRILVVSPASGSGKTEVAEALAKELGCAAAQTGLEIMADFALAHNYRTLGEVMVEKGALRLDLYEHGHLVAQQEEDPAIWVRRCFGHHDVGVVDGCRCPTELSAARKLVDHVVWVFRPGQRPAPGDHLVLAEHMEADDYLVLNDDHIEDLREQAIGLADCYLLEGDFPR